MNSSYWKFPKAGLLAHQPTLFRVAFPVVPCCNDSDSFSKKVTKLGKRSSIFSLNVVVVVVVVVEFSNREGKRKTKAIHSVQGWTQTNNDDEFS